MKLIKIRGARQHNLKDIDLDLPRDQFIVITGLSGSGKSSLAFDTLYAEGQRRYVSALSAYARHFLERLQKPDVDLIEGLSPAVAIDQAAASHNPRSTVGTVTEIYDYLRLLYARAGKPYCLNCELPIEAQTIDHMVDTLYRYPTGSRLIILAPVVDGSKGSHVALFKRLKRDGFARVRIDQTIYELDQVPALEKNAAHSIEVVIDRLVLKPDASNRMTDSLELAMSVSGGRAAVLFDTAQAGQPHPLYLAFSEAPRCPLCGATHAEVTPASFSFNAPQGACPACDGLGSQVVFDPQRIIPDPGLSLNQGAVAVWANHASGSYYAGFLNAVARHYGADPDLPFEALPEAFKNALLHGTGDRSIQFSIQGRRGEHIYDKPFEGLVAYLHRRYKETGSAGVREELGQYLAPRECPICKGRRLNPQSLNVRLNGIGIHQVAAMPISKALPFLKHLGLEGRRAAVGAKIVQGIAERMEFLKDLGLGYLSLDRPAHTLSGGESQRIRLAAQIGAKLTGMLYVLDEPSIGLHPRDTRRLLRTLLRMRDQGNTVLVVEHDRETIRACDHVVDMGPGAGTHGGHVLFSGPPQALPSCEASLTGGYLDGRLDIPVPQPRRSSHKGCISIHGACLHNLKGISASFPLGCLCCVTGVSGSGKSSLVIETLYPAVSESLNKGPSAEKHYQSVKGCKAVDSVLNIDQSPIGRTPRSNPGTYSGVFSLVRDLFCKTPDARLRGYGAGRFSFNTRGGRCEACSGEGILKIEMHFLPDVYVPCDSCQGRRYNRETLEVRYKGKKGYLQLGQSATTLSGGEAQRLKLARELGKKRTGKTLYILDEPTTGLHMEDVNRLLQVLGRLVESGNTVVVIEHNLDVIKTADYLIDLGPEGGEGGGYVIGSGTPEEIAAMGNSYTGQYLKPVLQGISERK
ncbi:MAG: excinuclease ABC subunit UvrA [Desulfosarcinaceae bacterium]